MSQQVETPTRTFTAGAAIGKYRRVTLSAGVLAAAGATTRALGTIENETFASGEKVAVRLRNAQGTRRMVAAGTITANTYVYAAASGKVAATGTVVEGFALEAATADGDYLEVLPVPDQDLVSISGDNDFDPAERTWVHFNFGQRIYTKAVASDWSVFKSVASEDLPGDWMLSGSATAYGAPTNSDGGTRLSASNSGALAFFKPRTGSKLNKIKWSSSKQPRLRLVLGTGTITATRFMVGLESIAVPKFLRNSAPDSNRIEVYFDQGADSRLHARKAGGASSSSGTLSGVIASSSIYDVELRLDSDRIGTVWVNGVQLLEFDTALAASKSLIPIIGFQAEGAKQSIVAYNGSMSQNIAA